MDIDGTLLNSTGQIPAENLQAIEEAAARGIEIVLVTGRRFDFALPIAEKIPGDPHLIVNNGALAKSLDGSTHIRFLLPRASALEILRATEEFRELWLHYLGLRILCPTEHLYKDEIVQAIYDRSPDAYYALHSCDFRKRGWCGYCDKCLITGAIVDALGLPRLFRMRASSYSEEVVEGLKSYRTGDYDPFWKLQVFRRLEDVFGYNFKI